MLKIKLFFSSHYEAFLGGASELGENLASETFRFALHPRRLSWYAATEDREAGEKRRSKALFCSLTIACCFGRFFIFILSSHLLKTRQT